MLKVSLPCGQRGADVETHTGSQRGAEDVWKGRAILAVITLHTYWLGEMVSFLCVSVFALYNVLIWTCTFCILFERGLTLDGWRSTLCYKNSVFHVDTCSEAYWALWNICITTWLIGQSVIVYFVRWPGSEKKRQWLITYLQFFFKICKCLNIFTSITSEQMYKSLKKCTMSEQMYKFWNKLSFRRKG